MLEKTLESPLDFKEIQPVHSKGNQSWVFFGGTDAKAGNSNTLATSCKELTHWRRLWFWEGLGAGGKGDNRGWDGWMASPPRWTWVWVNFGSWWWTGRPVVLQFLGSQRVGHTERLNWTEVTEYAQLNCFSRSSTKCRSHLSGLPFSLEFWPLIFSLLL